MGQMSLFGFTNAIEFIQFTSFLIHCFSKFIVALACVLQERLFVVIFNQHSQKCLKMLEMFENDKCLKMLAFGKCQHVTGGCF